MNSIDMKIGDLFTYIHKNKNTLKYLKKNKILKFKEVDYTQGDVYNSYTEKTFRIKIKSNIIRIGYYNEIVTEDDCAQSESYSNWIIDYNGKYVEPSDIYIIISNYILNYEKIIRCNKIKKILWILN